jgi:hypothetical protein
MKKLIFIIASILINALLFARPDDPVPPSGSNVIWHAVTVIDIKAGSTESAKVIIGKFESASEAAGTALPVIYWFSSGKYDLVVTRELKNGPDDVEGSWSPEDEKWWNALVVQEGSDEAAGKLLNDYLELVTSSLTSVSCKAK